jgi:hypothetical protein
MISGFVRSDISGTLYCSGGLTNSDTSAISSIGSGIGTTNIKIGPAGANVSIGSNNILIGNGAGASLSGGSNSFYAGSNAGNAVITSSTGIGIGYYSLARTTGAGNIALGYNSGGGILTGSDNFAIGHFSLAPYLSGVLTGTNNICIGRFTGTAYQSSESNNIIIGQNISGVAGESGVCRIGLSGSVNATYIDNKIFEMGAATSISGSLTLSGTWLKGLIINTASGTVLTMPTGANIQAAFPYSQANQMFEVKLCNVGGNVNLSGNTNTTLFTPTNPLTTSAVLKLMCTASGSWNVYV